MLVLIPYSLLLTLPGCGTKKNAVGSQAQVSEPTWHTCLVQGARANISMDGEGISATLTMQTVRDSLLIINVMPMLGIEMVRIEATPTEVIAVNKLDGVYAQATFAEINRVLTPSVNWDILQQICTAELPTGSDKARLLYSVGDKTIELVITYPARQTDVPLRIKRQRLDNYTQMDISQWL